MGSFHTTLMLGRILPCHQVAPGENPQAKKDARRDLAINQSG